MKHHIIISIKMLLLMTLLLGLFYPLFIIGISQITFPNKANGSLIIKNGKVIGSELIAQKFISNNYFWSRPSATDFNPMPSGGSNYGMINKKLQGTSLILQKQFIEKNELSNNEVPNEMIYSSASGLDPHISVKSALLQVNRIAKARNIDKDKIIQIINKQKENRQFYILGEERINVLLLNLELDKIAK